MGRFLIAFDFISLAPVLDTPMFSYRRAAFCLAAYNNRLVYRCISVVCAAKKKQKKCVCGWTGRTGCMKVSLFAFGFARHSIERNDPAICQGAGC